MSERPAYQRDAYLDHLVTRVVGTVPGKNGRLFVELEDTILYPEGGGQPADHGWIGGARVVSVRKGEGRIVHEVEGPEPTGEVEVRLDWERRYDHMQQHTTQHLLTSLASEGLGWVTTGFGIGSEVSYIDLNIKRPPAEELRELEALAAAKIRAAHPVRVMWVDREEMEALPVRSRRLPEELEGPIRLIEIEGIDLNTCGGTHVANTAELETVCLVDTEPMHGGTRVSWVAGGRVRQRMAAREALLEALRGITGSSDGDLARIVKLKLSRLKEVQGELRRLRERLARGMAEEMAGAAGPVVARHVEDGETIQAMLPALAGRAGAKAFLLVAADGTFAVALGEDVPKDAGALGMVAAEVLDGRGGGRDRLFRGKASRPGAIAVAARALEEVLAG